MENRESRTFDGHELYLLYEKKIIECRKTRQRCEEIKKTQQVILIEIKKRNIHIDKILGRYLEINQQILSELSNVIFKSEKEHAVIISLLLNTDKESISKNEIIQSILKITSPDIHISTESGDANLNNAGNDITQK
jgi:hypothetical protein